MNPQQKAELFNEYWQSSSSSEDGERMDYDSSSDYEPPAVVYARMRLQKANTTTTATAMKELDENMGAMEISEQPVAVVAGKKPCRSDVLRAVRVNATEAKKKVYPTSGYRPCTLVDRVDVYSLTRKELEKHVGLITNKPLHSFNSQELREFLVDSEKKSSYYFGPVVSMRVRVNDWKENYYMTSPSFLAFVENERNQYRR